MYVSKGERSNGGSPDRWSEGFKKWAEDRPALAEYLTMAAYPDGSERLTSTMIVLVEAGRFKVCLSDRDQARSLWVVGDTIEQCLATLEEDLQLGVGDWRRSGGGNGRKQK